MVRAGCNICGKWTVVKSSDDKLSHTWSCWFKRFLMKLRGE